MALSTIACILLVPAGVLTDRDGGVAMAIMFTVGPAIALLLGIVGGLAPSAFVAPRR